MRFPRSSQDDHRDEGGGAIGRVPTPSDELVPGTMGSTQRHEAGRERCWEGAGALAGKGVTVHVNGFFTAYTGARGAGGAV